MADNVTTYTIKNGYYMELDLEYNGHSFKYKNIFYPMKLSKDFIVGHDSLIGKVFPFFQQVYSQYHEAWINKNDILECDSIDSISISNVTKTTKLRLYDNLRDMELGQVNELFKDKRAHGSATLNIVQKDNEWCIVAKSPISNSVTVCTFTDQPHVTLQECDSNHTEYLFDSLYMLDDECVFPPSVEKYEYGPLIQDNLDPLTYNVSFEKNIANGKTTINVKSTTQIKVGTELSIRYGKTFWIYWLRKHHNMDPEKYNDLVYRVNNIYGGLPTDIIPKRMLADPFENVQAPAPEDDFIPNPHSISDDILPLKLQAEFKEMFHVKDDLVERQQIYTDTVINQIRPEFLAAVPALKEYMLLPHVRDVFVYNNWEGLKHPSTGEPWIHEITWLKIPEKHNAYAVRIKPELVEPAHKEFKHLTNIGYYKESTSHITSSMVIAPKATNPYLRIVSNYSWTRGYICTPKYPVPIIKDALGFIKNGAENKPFVVFADLDMLASFHQLRIDEASKPYLSVITPWGQFEPQFLPEGIPPATAMLQATVEKLFAGMKNRLLTIFDNFLLCGTDYNDLFIHLKKLIDICTQSNMKLKLSKCFLGVDHVKFFGYVCTGNSFSLEAERSETIGKIPFPGDVGTTRVSKVKLLQRYLGAANFHAGFILHYSTITAPLYDMTKPTFDWNPLTWKENYQKIFNDHKIALKHSYTLFFSDFSLEWILRPDASNLGCGASLFQVFIEADGTIVNQPLYMVSHKFSAAAVKWHTMHQEAYAIFYSVKKLAHLLRGKPFIIQSDHRNLLFMEKSQDSKIIRMVQYLANFTFQIEHIPGKLNLVADFLSRMFPEHDSSTIQACAIDIYTDPSDYLYAAQPLYENNFISTEELLDSDIQMDTILNYILNELNDQDIFGKVHGGREGHHGILRTWGKLNKYFPGHKLTTIDVENLINKCATCQRTRESSNNATLQSSTKALPVKHNRYILAMDTASVNESPRGNKYILVIYNLFTKYVVLYPVAEKTAIQTARCLFTYYCVYGMCEFIHSDQGSDFLSNVMTHLHEWLGTRRTLALVKRPQADGVEPVIKQVLRNITALVNDERIGNNWDLPEHIGIIQLIQNETVHWETNVSPLEATYGSVDAGYFAFPTLTTEQTSNKDFVDHLTKYLADVRQVSLEYQLKCKFKRMSDPDTIFNKFQPGQFIL